MKVLFKYIFWLLSFFTLVIFYLLGTTLGHVTLGKLVENHYSKKLENKIEIGSLNIENYPYIIAETKINGATNLWLEGDCREAAMKMNYYLKGDSFKWNDYLVSTPIEINGTIHGKISELLVRGEGDIFAGQGRYSFTTRTHFEDYEKINGHFTEVNGTEVLKFLHYEEMLEGEMNLSIDFDILSAYRKKGFAKVSMPNAMMPEVSGKEKFSLEAEIEFKDLLHTFFIEVNSPIGKLRIANGHYNGRAGLIQGDYTLHIYELGYFKKFLNHDYKGALKTVGTFKYEDGNFSCKGDTTSYEGLLAYDYTNDYLDLYFTGVSLENLLRQLSYPPLLSANVYGSASYDLKDEIILVNTELKNTRFRKTKLTNIIYAQTGIDILKEVYNETLFTAGYQGEVLTSFLKIDNGVNHFYLKDMRLNSKTNAIGANFEVQLENQEFVGKVYGTLEEPQVSLEMFNIIQYQINKSIESFLGSQQPSKSADKREEESSSFFDGFF